MNDSFERDTAYHVRLLVDHVPSMLAYWDRNLQCRFANRAYERWFGVDPEGLVGTSLRDLLGPDLFAQNEPYIRGALNGQEQVFERVVPGHDGVKRHGLATYIPDIEGGEVRGFIAHVAEVTQLKQAKEALREEVRRRERANELLQASASALREAQRLGQIGSWTWEADSDITTWSDELYLIFGRDPKLMPPPLAEHPALYTPESWRRLEAAIAASLKSVEPYQLELEYRRADGGTGWLEARGEAVRDDLGAVSGLRGTVLEVSKRRAAEATRIQLQVTEAANRNKSLLLSKVSHELRTPLNAIMGFAQLCEADTRLDPQHRRWAGTIVASGQHMLELVNEVLDLSAADSGELTLRLGDVDLVSVIRGALVQLAAMAQAAGVQLVGPGSSQPIQLRSDPTRLRQVIDNLLSNAIKYSLPGSTVNVSIATSADRVEMLVSDAGRGMTEDQLGRLFQPFERLGAEFTKIPGTGLGLALTKALVEQLGGTISATSRADVGSTFIASFPLLDAR